MKHWALILYAIAAIALSGCITFEPARECVKLCKEINPNITSLEYSSDAGCVCGHQEKKK